MLMFPLPNQTLPCGNWQATERVAELVGNMMWGDSIILQRRLAACFKLETKTGPPIFATLTHQGFSSIFLQQSHEMVIISSHPTQLSLVYNGMKIILWVICRLKLSKAKMWSSGTGNSLWRTHILKIKLKHSRTFSSALVRLYPKKNRHKNGF